MTELGPAFRLFCLALRQQQSADDLRRMRELAAAITDWNVILLGARRHRVASVVLAGLRACSSPHLPLRVLDELHRLSVANAQRGLAQAAEIGRLARLFADAGVPLLVLKGEILATQLYGRVGWRAARDIDLLVDPSRLPEAQALLVKAGYSQGPSFSSRRLFATYTRAIKEVEFHHVATGGLVELHYRLADNADLLPIEFASLWDEREAVRIGDTAVSTIPRHRLPLYLCVHGAGHGWSRLQWLVDFAGALAPSRNTTAMLETADACGLRWPFLHALELAHEWLGLPIDDINIAEYRNSRQMRRRRFLFARLYSRTDWYEETPHGFWNRLLRQALWQRLYRFSLRSDWHYRVTQMRRAWVSPPDWDTVPLPGALSFLYPLVRPWGWLIRRGPPFGRHDRRPGFGSPPRRSARSE